MIHHEQDIIDWGIARNILGPTGEGTKVAQLRKTREEVDELYLSITLEGDQRNEAKDAIGDIIVTLVMQAQMWDLTMEECIEAAWLQIKDRKGRMVNGVFVKEV